MTELTKIISEKWKAVDQATHDKYEAMAQSEKKKHAEALAAYEEKYGKVERKRKSKKSKHDDDDSEEEKKPKKTRKNKDKQIAQNCHEPNTARIEFVRFQIIILVSTCVSRVFTSHGLMLNGCCR
eukprot:TRINITY_DN3681_c0_g2_i2.p2 TRINITY_DN3681_c0_g2~~TRINITY_DN3681_c0_g2_i2.p2  ORF type:complete len:125 (+),score=17.51 TRINITY_DN3681_c0_g2_i2:288-662(+)